MSSSTLVPTRPHIAFVVFSIHADPAYRKRYLDEGARRFLDKATEFDQLASALNAYRVAPPEFDNPSYSQSALAAEPMKKKTLPQTGPPPDAYALALEEERRLWHILQGVPRSNPRRSEALSDWQAAADRISVEAAKLLKRHPAP